MTESRDIRLPQIGEIIECKGHNLMIVELLASGPFSEVFKVRRVENAEEFYAMKLEMRDNPRRMLKLDAYVLTAMNEANIDGFPKILACGRTSYYDFIIMQLIGQNLGRLRRASMNKKFSLATALRVAQLTLSRIESLHHGGFISRDIKAANFAIGAEPNDPSIYMFDFGLARRFRDKDGNHYPPRKVAALLGTVAYASLATHETLDQCRRDDLESWFYMCVEMISGRLPWDDMIMPNFQQHMIVADMKRYCRSTGRHHFLQDCPPEFHTIFDIINATGYYQTPDYWLIRVELKRIADRLDMCQVFDWNLPGSDILERSEVVGDNGETHLVSLRLRERREQTISAAQSITCRNVDMGSPAAIGTYSPIQLETPPIDD